MPIMMQMDGKPRDGKQQQNTQKTGWEIFVINDEIVYPKHIRCQCNTNDVNECKIWQIFDKRGQFAIYHDIVDVFIETMVLCLNELLKQLDTIIEALEFKLKVEYLT